MGNQLPELWPFVGEKPYEMLFLCVCVPRAFVCVDCPLGEKLKEAAAACCRHVAAVGFRMRQDPSLTSVCPHSSGCDSAPDVRMLSGATSGARSRSRSFGSKSFGRFPSCNLQIVLWTAFGFFAVLLQCVPW